MTIQELVSLGPKTTMRIGGNARAYADMLTKDDVEAAERYARGHRLPLIVLGGGSNTIFADGVIEALVVRIKADSVLRQTQHKNGALVTVQSGTILASLINELAGQNLDLSPLTGIPGTVGGAIFGNAGQGPGGIWIDHYVASVTVYTDGQWHTLTRDECCFSYRDSVFKQLSHSLQLAVRSAPIIWETTLSVPTKPALEIHAEVERLLKLRLETQPHLKTAGSCFTALPDGTPAWRLIDHAGLRGQRFGDLQISEKHANFLLNLGNATFDEAVEAVRLIQGKTTALTSVEMRFYDSNGSCLF